MSKSKSKSSSKSKVEFPMSREDFKNDAPAALKLQVEGNLVTVGLKEFSTGSLGYFGNGPLVIEINGEKVQGNFQFQWIAKGSKEAE